MPAKYKILFCLAPAVLLLDQFTKYLVMVHMPIGSEIGLIAGFLDLVHIRNEGAAFGLLSGVGESVRVPFFYGVTLVAFVILFYAFRSLNGTNRFYAYPFSLICGGVLGNLIDRIRFGNVVDFISIHLKEVSLWGIALEWPAFNMADSAITLSMIAIFFQILKGK